MPCPSRGSCRWTSTRCQVGHLSLLHPQGHHCDQQGTVARCTHSLRHPLLPSPHCQLSAHCHCHRWPDPGRENPFVVFLTGGRTQPFYHVKVDERDQPGTVTYVAQENVEIVRLKDATHEDLLILHDDEVQPCRLPRHVQSAWVQNMPCCRAGRWLQSVAICSEPELNQELSRGFVHSAFTISPNRRVCLDSNKGATALGCGFGRLRTGRLDPAPHGAWQWTVCTVPSAMSLPRFFLASLKALREHHHFDTFQSPSKLTLVRHRRGSWKMMDASARAASSEACWQEGRQGCQSQHLVLTRARSKKKILLMQCLGGRICMVSTLVHANALINFLTWAEQEVLEVLDNSYGGDWVHITPAPAVVCSSPMQR